MLFGHTAGVGRQVIGTCVLINYKAEVGGQGCLRFWMGAMVIFQFHFACKMEEAI